MPIPRFSSTTALLFAIVLTSLMSGCVPWARGIRTIDETVTDWRDFVWGKRAFYQRYGHDRTGPFMDGFLEGYHDILQGGDGCLPVVPPRKYWSWKYQSAGGQGAVSEWFSGYSAGVEAAKEDGLSNLSRVPCCSEYNGTSTVPIQGTFDGEIIHTDQEDKSGTIPIPPTIDPNPNLDKGAFYHDGGKRKNGSVKPSSFSNPSVQSWGRSSGYTNQTKSADSSKPSANSVIPFGAGMIEVSPVIRSQDSKQTPLNFRFPAGDRMMLPARQDFDQPLPSNR